MFLTLSELNPRDPTLLTIVKGHLSPFKELQPGRQETTEAGIPFGWRWVVLGPSETGRDTVSEIGRTIVSVT